jgi:hypothetical protein
MCFLLGGTVCTSQDCGRVGCDTVYIYRVEMGLYRQL